MTDTAPSYGPKVYRAQGGDIVRVKSGGLIDIETGGDLKYNGDSLIDEIAALSGLDSNELTLLNGAGAAGAITASKVATRDAGSRIPLKTAVVAALGNSAGTAAAITSDINLVTGADDTVGVILPVGVAGMAIQVVNTVTTALLKVYPDTGGNINAVGANTAFSLAAGKTATFVCTAALTWYVSKIAVAMSGDATQDGAGALTIANLAVNNAKIATAAAIARSKLATDAAQKYQTTVIDLNGVALANAELAGSFNAAVVGGVPLIQAEVTDNETEVSVGYATFRLPPEYVAAADLTFRIPCALIKTAAAVNNGSTIDVEAFLKNGAGGIGADICATLAQTFAADDTWYDKDFTITGTTLSPGDEVLFKITSSVVDSEAGAGTLRLTAELPAVLAGIKG